jgi:predicted DNA-binding ribbon-helix-helix protein
LRVQEGRLLGRRPAIGTGTPTATAPRPLLEEDQAGRRELEGRLRVWVGRFLHLETDLLYHVEKPSTGAPPRSVRVRGSQRMNSGEDLFYLDHPVIGMIARVTRMDEVDEDETT